MLQGSAMWRFLRLVLTIVMAATLGVAATSSASAAQSCEHSQSISVAVSISQSGQLSEWRCHHHHADGKCSCPSCCSAGSLALATPVKSLGVETNRFIRCALPKSSARAGIVVRPVTGPPKLAI
jgi:hypothetical protein